MFRSTGTSNTGRNYPNAWLPSAGVVPFWFQRTGDTFADWIASHAANQTDDERFRRAAVAASVFRVFDKRYGASYADETWPALEKELRVAFARLVDRDVAMRTSADDVTRGAYILARFSSLEQLVASVRLGRAAWEDLGYGRARLRVGERERGRAANRAGRRDDDARRRARRVPRARNVRRQRPHHRPRLQHPRLGRDAQPRVRVEPRHASSSRGARGLASARAGELDGRRGSGTQALGGPPRARDGATRSQSPSHPRNARTRAASAPYTARDKRTSTSWRSERPRRATPTDWPRPSTFSTRFARA